MQHVDPNSDPFGKKLEVLKKTVPFVL